MRVRVVGSGRCAGKGDVVEQDFETCGLSVQLLADILELVRFCDAIRIGVQAVFWHVGWLATVEALGLRQRKLRDDVPYLARKRK